jgi:hypothetical protein
MDNHGSARVIRDVLPFTERIDHGASDSFRYSRNIRTPARRWMRRLPIIHAIAQGH